MDLNKYINMPNVIVPTEIKLALEQVGGITKVEYSNKNIILTDHQQWTECGYDKLEDNSYLVSVAIEMPNVTKEMVSWWFWWHAQDSERYKAWFPKEHYKISYHKKDKEYFANKLQPPFQSNIQYPIERIGKLVAPLSIEFVHPSDFGFDEELMNTNNVEIITCGHVGAFNGLIPNTEMAHVFIQTKDGPLWVSRFWLGKNVKSSFLKKLLVTPKQAKGMALHCYVEYHNFAHKIPLMYEEWLQEVGI